MFFKCRLYQSIMKNGPRGMREELLRNLVLGQHLGKEEMPLSQGDHRLLVDCLRGVQISLMPKEILLMCLNLMFLLQDIKYGEPGAPLVPYNLC